MNVNSRSSKMLIGAPGGTKVSEAPPARTREQIWDARAGGEGKMFGAGAE
jgi:hypothetical protein